MKRANANTNDVQSMLKKHRSDIINKLDAMHLSKKDHTLAMNYLKKGEQLANNIYKDPIKLNNFTNSINKANTTEDIMQVLTNIFKTEFIQEEGKKAIENLNKFCEVFKSKEAQEKLKDCDQETKKNLQKMIEVLSSN
jgi:hypothetical protein